MMPLEKIQPWRIHWTPHPASSDIAPYQEKQGAEIIADGGSAGPPVDAFLSTEAKTKSIPEANKLCPHLKPITNPTLPGR
ncbi:hypothetical protein SCAR479_07121 [Seiridium cardinale]|uniref:Uncharacterized protein n=1 Tax=Seiridium cardinale TaxID=138064 RepID=A0ABR2XRJ2_9PEZI